jgi:hypothetical protein
MLRLKHKVIHVRDTALHLTLLPISCNSSTESTRRVMAVEGNPVNFSSSYEIYHEGV